MKTPHTTKEELLKKLGEKGVEITPLLEKALEQAYQSHKDQIRHDGVSAYLTQHIYPVAADLLDAWEEKDLPELLVVGALLHEVIEDDPEVSEEDFITKFGQEVYEIVKPLTLPDHENVPGIPQEEKKDINRRHVQRVKTASRLARLIKLADKANNLSSLSAIRHKHPERFLRNLEETEETFLPFAQRESQYYYERLQDILQELKKVWQLG